MQNRLLSPTLMIVIGSIMISFCAVFVKLTTTGPTIDGFYRMLFGGIILLFVSFASGQKLWTGWQPFCTALLAGFLFAADISYWHVSIETIGPGLATTLVNLQVLPLALLGILVYKDSVDYRFVAAIPVALVGLYLLVGQEWGHYTEQYKIGIWQSFAAMSMYACYTITLRKSQTLEKKLNPIPNLAIISLTAAVILAMVAYHRGESFISYNPHDWFWLVLYGIFGQVFGWLFISAGIANTTISQAGLLLLLQPGFSMTWDIWLLGRPTHWWEYLGTTITLIAIYFGATGRKVTPSTQQSD